MFRLWHPEEDHDEGYHVEASVQAEGANDTQGGEDGRERHRQDGSPEQTSGDRPCHADLSMGKWKDLGRVGKRNGSFAGRVKGAKDIHEQGDETKMGRSGAGDERAQAGGEKGPGHLRNTLATRNPPVWRLWLTYLRKGEQKQGASAKGVDGPLYAS